MSYAIIRYFENRELPNELVHTVDTLEAAQDHCSDPRTASATATGPEALERTRKFGGWFDGYTEVRS